MLRIDRRNGTIPIDYQDPYLELVHLLTEGAALEHALMIAYLYGLFSIKDRYAAVRGDLSTRSYLEHSPAGPDGDAPTEAAGASRSGASSRMTALRPTAKQ